MIAKKIKILIKSDGSYLDTILPPITANEDGRTIVQVIAPFPITDIVSVNYSIRPIQATVKGSYLVPTGKFGKDVLADDYTHFQTVADWNVFEIPINAVALEYISKYRAGLVLVSFAITQLQTPYFATNYLGLFSNTQPIPATSYNDGDYFIANEYNFTAHDITWAKGDYAYFYNGKWNKGKSVLKASTPSIELPVDPSLKDAPQLEYDEDVALLLVNDLGLLTQRVSQSETDIESAENDINEIDGRVGVNETDIYNLESDVDGLETEIGNIKNGTLVVKKAEQDQLGNVINTTYETKTVVSGINTRVINLENANMVKSVAYQPLTYVITFTFFDNTTQSLDLPLESTIVGASYDNITKDITFTLQNGETLVVPLDDLVSGLASETWVTTYFIPKTALKTAFSGTPLDTNVISEKLAKDSLDLKEDLANKATDFSVVNDTKYPTTKAVAERLLNLPIAELNNHTLREVFEVGMEVPLTTPYWSANAGTIANTPNGLMFTCTSENYYAGVYSAITGLFSGRAYYIGISGNNLKQPNHTGFDSNTTTSPVINNRVSVVRTMTASNAVVFYQYMNTGEQIEYTDFKLIDMSTLGIQSLTKEQMDYWFNVYQTLRDTNDANAIFSLFAPKQQEAWLTPTLVNGTTGDVKYMKDNFGFVHFKGSITAVIPAISNNVMILPVGYRPSNQDTLFPVVKGDFLSLATLLISNNGGVLNGYEGKVFLDGITFKAEA